MRPKFQQAISLLALLCIACTVSPEPADPVLETTSEPTVDFDATVETAIESTTQIEQAVESTVAAMAESTPTVAVAEVPTSAPAPPTPTAVPSPVAVPTPTPAAQSTPTSIAVPVPTQSTSPFPTAQATLPPPEITLDPRSGGTLNVLGSDPITLDPHLANDTFSAPYIYELYSGLVRFNDDLQIVGDLAESWTIGADGLVYIFTLAPDLAFSDGTPVRSSDVKWSWERSASLFPESKFGIPYLQGIAGFSDVVNGSASELRGVSLIDDRTIEVTLDRPDTNFLAKLTVPAACVLSVFHVVTSGDDWTRALVGTGPFSLQEYLPGQRLILARNVRYARDIAFLDRVAFNIAGGIGMQMYETDEIDTVGVGLADRQRVQDPTGEFVDELVQMSPKFEVDFIGFNFNQPPMDDPDFRKALVHAVDKQLIADAVFGQTVEPAYGVFPPGFPGFNQNLTGLDFDLETAKDLLSASAYSDAATRPPIVVKVAGGGGSPTLTVEIVADMWRNNLGVEATISQIDQNSFYRDFWDINIDSAAYTFQWTADYASQDQLLELFFAFNGHLNAGNYYSDDMDALLKQARIEFDDGARDEIYSRAEQIAIDDAAWLPLWHDVGDLVLVKPWVKGLTFPPVFMAHYGRVYIEQ